MKRILIIGAGFTGSSIIHYLRNVGKICIPNVKIYDASNGLNEFGGRMVTDQRFINGKVAACDLGAQYLTRYRDESNDVFDYLENIGVIQSFNAKTGIIAGVRERAVSLPHYSVPGGVSNVVKSFLQDTAVSWNTQVQSIDFATDSILVRSIQNNTTVLEEEFDYVISTLHGPFLKEIDGNFGSVKVYDKSLREKLNEIEYSNRFALGLYYSIPEEYFRNIIEPLTWKVKYIYDNPIVRYLSFEYWKGMNRVPLVPDENGNIFLSILIHTNIDFAKQYQQYDPHDLKQREEVYRLILNELSGILPAGFPAQSPVDWNMHFWKYSQMLKGFSYGDGDLGSDLKKKDKVWVFNGSGHLPREEGGGGGPHFIVAGEMFTESNFEGCLESAKEAVSSLNKLL
jgi:renalase